MSEPTLTEMAGFRGLVARGGDRGLPPVVILHSAFADHDSYQNYLRTFSEAGFDCYAISRRGRAGRPTSEIQGVGISDYCEDVVAVLEEIGGSPVVVGHSIGGLIGLKVAEAGRCRMLVLLAAPPPWMMAPNVRAALGLMPQLPAIILGRPFAISEPGASQLLLNAIAPGDRAVVYGGFHRESGLAFRQLMLGAVDVDTSRVRCPLLYVRGDDDRVVSERVARRIARTYRGDYREFQGMGHWLASEPGWEGPAAAMVEWIEARL